MELTARLAMATYTPITHWMSMPWVKACAWSDRVARIQEEDRKKVQR